MGVASRHKQELKKVKRLLASKGIVATEDLAESLKILRKVTGKDKTLVTHLRTADDSVLKEAFGA